MPPLLPPETGRTSDDKRSDAVGAPPPLGGHTMPGPTRSRRKYPPPDHASRGPGDARGRPRIARGPKTVAMRRSRPPQRTQLKRAPRRARIERPDPRGECEGRDPDELRVLFEELRQPAVQGATVAKGEL